MNFFDLHCDTAYEMYHKRQGLADNNLAVSLDAFEKYDKKAEIFAVWSDNNKKSEDVYSDFFDIFENLKAEVDKNCERAVICSDAATLSEDDGRLKIIPAVEGASLLGKDLTRLEILREYGVRVLTLMWGGINELGGAHDTETGLTDFGCKAVEMCEKLGIIVDVSHISEKGFWDVANMAKKPFIASHSNAFTICSNSRNLSDTMLRTIVSKCGISGINLVASHLSKAFEDRECSEEQASEAVIKHLAHFIEKGNEKSVCFGSDFDGIKPLPGFETPDKIIKLAEKMKQNGASDTLINDVFYNNAYNFFIKNL